MGRGTILTRLGKDGAKRYTTIIRINGKQQWRTWDRKKDAEDYLDQLSPDVRDGSYREIKKATFGEYLERWQAAHLLPEQFKPSTYNTYRSIIELHLLPAFKNYPMLAITAAEINTFSAKLLQQNGTRRKNSLSRKTVRNVLNLLGEIFAKAVAEGYLRHSPMEGVDKPRADKEQKGRALKPDEIQSILRSAEGIDRTMIATAISTGMRRAEQFGLDWSHVDFERDVIKVRRSLYWQFGKYHGREEGQPAWTYVSPKSKMSVRDIDMSPELCRELRELYLRSGKKGLVFCTPKGTPINPDNFVKRNFAAVLRRAEAERARAKLPPIGKVRWHDLRHTFGSLKIDQGEDLLYVSRQMGHSSISVTADIYAHQIRVRRPEAAAKTDAMIFGS
jgi:integrase